MLSDGQEYRQSQAPVTFSWLQHILHAFTVNLTFSRFFILFSLTTKQNYFPYVIKAICVRHIAQRFCVGKERHEGSTQNLSSIVAGSAGVIAALIYASGIDISSSVSWELFLCLQLLISKNTRGHTVTKSCFCLV